VRYKEVTEIIIKIPVCRNRNLGNCIPEKKVIPAEKGEQQG
jgi:hypothetical protein